MQVAVSYDNTGAIKLLFDPAQMRKAKLDIGYEPAPGENHRLLDIPQQFQGKPLNEFAHSLHVHTSGGQPRLEVRK